MPARRFDLLKEDLQRSPQGLFPATAVVVILLCVQAGHFDTVLAVNQEVRWIVTDLLDGVAQVFKPLACLFLVLSSQIDRGCR